MKNRKTTSRFKIRHRLCKAVCELSEFKPKVWKTIVPVCFGSSAAIKVGFCLDHLRPTLWSWCFYIPLFLRWILKHKIIHFVETKARTQSLQRYNKLENLFKYNLCCLKLSWFYSYSNIFWTLDTELFWYTGFVCALTFSLSYWAVASMLWRTIVALCYLPQ